MQFPGCSRCSPFLWTRPTLCDKFSSVMTNSFDEKAKIDHHASRPGHGPWKAAWEGLNSGVCRPFGAPVTSSDALVTTSFLLLLVRHLLLVAMVIQ